MQSSVTKELKVSTICDIILEYHSPGKGHHYHAVAKKAQARSLLFDNGDADKEFTVHLVTITRENVPFNRGFILQNPAYLP